MQKQYENCHEAERAFGKNVARKYIQRINIIKQTYDINELTALPGLNCHPLKVDRKGQWALKLTGFYRLVITVQGKMLEIVQIEEVSKHYDE